MTDNPKAPSVEHRIAAETAIAAEALRRKHAGGLAPKPKGPTSSDWIVIGVVMGIAIISAFVLGRMG